MLKRTMPFLFVMLFMAMAFTLSAATNTWNGSFNAYWHNISNWSLGHIPTSSEDVVIPGGVSRYPHVYTSDEQCLSLDVQSGAILYIGAYKLQVSNDVSIAGTLSMVDASSKLYCDNITWESGSTANSTTGASFMVRGIWEFSNGAEVFLNSGNVYFYGSSTASYIRAKDDDSYFYNVFDYKQSTRLAVSSLSTNDVLIHGYLYIATDAEFRSYSSDTKIKIDHRIYNYDGHLYLDYGTVEFTSGGNSQFKSGDYFNNLIINAYSGTVAFDNPVEVKGNLIINSGTFNPNNNDITVGGNWTNNVGDSGFSEGTGRVIFNGTAHQYCSDEHFNILEVNKSSGAFRMNNTDVVCETYDWTSGAIDVLAGSFTANDLADTGIFGNWYVNTNGTINIHQDTASGQYIDLDGNIHIYGGTMNIWGGNGYSYWSYGADASLDMNGGTLDFKDNGIYIYNSGTYSFSENITGGTIKVYSGLRISNSNFTPTGGTLELYGSSDVVISQTAGTLYNFKVNKSTVRENENIEYFYKRDGTKIPITRSNKLTLNTDITVDHDLTLENGTIEMGAHSITVSHDFDVYGTILMHDSASNINVSHIFNWYSGSVGNITAGNITTNYVYKYSSGANVSQSTDVTLTMGGSSAYVIQQDDDSNIGNLIVNSSNLYFNTSSDTIRVIGDLTINNPSNLRLELYKLRVDGDIFLDSGSLISVSSGRLVVNSDFSPNGSINLGIGNIVVNGAFDIPSGAALTINGGTLTDNGTYVMDINGTFNMTSGTLYATESIRIGSGATTSVSGGLIDCRVFLMPYASTFQPTGGEVKIRPHGLATINCGTGNNFYKFTFDSPSHGGQLDTDVTVTNDLQIKNGYIKLNGHTLTVGNDCTIWGSLRMDNSADYLDVFSDLLFKDVSSSIITDGNISCRVLETEIGTTATLTSNNTLTITRGGGGAEGYIIDRETNFHIQNLVIDNSLKTSLFGIADTLFVDGDLIINPSRTFDVMTYNLRLSGQLSLPNTATFEINGGYFRADNDFVIDGEMDLDGGMVDLHCSTDIGNTGSLVINNGTFNNGGTYIFTVGGNLSMSNGVLNLNGDSISFLSGSTSNITGGTINTMAFSAEHSGNFQPSGGTVVIYHNTGTAMIACSSGNYFYDLKIDSPSHGAQLVTTVNVHHNLVVENGFLKLNANGLYVVNEVEIKDNLIMDEFGDVLDVNDTLKFGSSSSSTINKGTIYCRVLDVMTGSTAKLEGYNILYIQAPSGAGIGYLAISEPNFSLHDVYIDAVDGSTLLSIPDTLDVTGYFTVLSSRSFALSDYNMKVEENMSISSGATMSTGSGTLRLLTDFFLDGTLNVDSGGSILLDKSFVETSTGSLTINGGNFIAHGTASTQINGNFSLPDGLFRVYYSLSLGSSSNITVAGGIISAKSFTVNGTNTFQPTGGIVELISNGATGSIDCENGSYFYDLNINSIDRVELNSDVEVHHNMSILNGPFRLNGKSMDVYGNMTISGTLEMHDSADLISIDGSMTWNSNSLGSINNGRINLDGDLFVQDNTVANITTSNVFDFVGSGDSYISIEVPDFSFANLSITKNSGNKVVFNDDNLTDPLKIMEDLDINSGTLDLRNGSIYAHKDVNVNNGTELKLNAGVQLYVEDNITIDNGATLNSVIASGSQAKISGITDYYAFNVESGGTISAENTTFEKMDTNGVYIKSGAFVDTSHPLNNCTFKNSNGVLLKVENGQNFTVNNAEFISGSSKNATVNVEKTVNSGQVTFNGATGSFAGPDYENDNYNRIIWAGYGPDLRVTAVSYSDTNPYLADDVEVMITIQNNGNASYGGTPNLYIDFFNNPSSVPVFGDYGDYYNQVSRTIAKGDTIIVRMHISNNTVENWNSYILLDTDELISEIDETNNLWGPDAISWQALPAVTNLAISLSGGNTTLTWNYSISADSYKIYKTTDPYNYSGATILTSTIKRYTEATSGDKYFYAVTAVRNYPPTRVRNYIVNKKSKDRRRQLK